MTRPALSVVMLAALPAAAFGGVFVPGPAVPREFFARPDADPAAEAERDPAKLAERVAKNVRTAGDNLKAKDAGPTTHKAQADALRDIDELLKQAETPPPPPSGSPTPMPMPQGGSGGDDMPPPMPMGGQGQGSPMPGGGKQPAGGPPMGQPMPGNGDPMAGPPAGGKPNGKSPSWRDKAGADGEPMPMPMGDPMPRSPGQGKPGTGPAGGGPAPGAVKSTPAPPAEDAVAKQVWGHLPERLRQEMNQYYKEQFMPKYGDLLRQYYGTLAEREAGPRRKD